MVAEPQTASAKVYEIRSRESNSFPSEKRISISALEPKYSGRDVYLSNETIGGGIRSLVFAQSWRPRLPSIGETTLHVLRDSAAGIGMDVVDNQWG